MEVRPRRNKLGIIRPCLILCNQWTQSRAEQSSGCRNRWNGHCGRSVPASHNRGALTRHSPEEYGGRKRKVIGFCHGTLLCMRNSNLTICTFSLVLSNTTRSGDCFFSHNSIAFPLSVSVGFKTYTVLYPEPRLQATTKSAFLAATAPTYGSDLGGLETWPNQFLLDHYGLRALRNAKGRITGSPQMKHKSMQC